MKRARIWTGSWLLSLALVADAGASETLYLQAAAALRQSPARSARSLLNLEAGRSVESQGSRGGWTHVELPGPENTPALRGWLPDQTLGPEPPEATIQSGR